MARVVHNCVFWGLAALVLVAPLPLGGNRPWAWFLISAWAGGLLTLWLAALTLTGCAPPIAARRFRAAQILFAGVCLWAVVQWTPWTPDSWHHPMWADASRALGQELTGRISVSPERTLTALVRLSGYGAVFWLALQLGCDFGRARRGLHLLVYAGALYALYGLFVQFSGSEKILWMDKWAYPGVVTSTFVNRNSYATFAGLVLVCAFALFLEKIGDVLGSKAQARVKARLWVERLLGPAAPLLVLMLVVATSLVLTGSRAGTFSALLALLVLLAAAFVGRTLAARQAGALSALLLLAAAAVFLMSGDNLAERVSQSGAGEATASGRGAAYAVVVRAIGDAPLVGAGYGSFADVFPLYRDDTVADPLSWDKAHNTYLENALELGVPAAAALCGAVLSCVWHCWRGIRRRRRHRVYPAVGVAATALVAVHSTVDFSLQVPAVSVTYAFILGIACAQSIPTRHVRGRRSSLAAGLASQPSLEPNAIPE